MQDEQTPIWIRSIDDVSALADAIAATDTIYLDSESNSMFAYRERICLLQFNLSGTIYLVDTLALPLEPNPLEALVLLFANPNTTTILHGGEYDVACLKRDYGIAPARVFDTQQAASMLGFERTGYGALADAICDVSLPKAARQYDWGTRPIDEEALRYAIDDVVYLPTIHTTLAQRVLEADLEEEVTIANQVVADAAAHQPEYDPSTSID